MRSYTGFGSISFGPDYPCDVLEVVDLQVPDVPFGVTRIPLTNGRVARIRLAKSYRRPLQRGDVMRRPRGAEGDLALYDYGIYNPPYGVIELTSDLGEARNHVHEVTLADFARGQPIHLEEYRNRTPLVPGQVVDRALAMVGEEEFDFLTHNCEHMVNWCKYSEKFCSQVWLAAGWAPYITGQSRPTRDERRRLLDRVDHAQATLTAQRRSLSRFWDAEQGTRHDSLLETCQQLRSSIQAGDPVRMVQALRQMVHSYDGTMLFDSPDDAQAYVTEGQPPEPSKV